MERSKKYEAVPQACRAPTVTASLRDFVQRFVPSCEPEDVQGKRKYASPGDPSEQNGCLNSF